MPLSEIMLQRLEDWKQAAMQLAPLLLGQTPERPLADIRADYNRELARNRPPAGVTSEDVDMGGVPGMLVTPDNARGGRVLFYIHGGGYISGGPSGYLGLAGHYARRLGARVFLPDYRLAPDHAFPASLDDVVTAWRWLVEREGGAANIVISGNSAGGAIVVSSMVRARRLGLALPVGGVAISPWANLEMTGASYTTRDGIDPLCNREILTLMARCALGTTPAGDPDASPVFADVRGLPPVMIQVGESEVMLSDAFQLAAHLTDHRVRTTLEVWPEMFHVWPMFTDILPEAQQALDSAARFLDSLLPSA